MKVEISNIGPHAKLTLELAPGLNVLRGRNGAGKSVAVAAIVAAEGGKARVEKKDGAPPGSVIMDGATVLKVGARINRDGSPSVEMGGYSEVGTIVDPGIKDPEVADAARVKAILGMIKVPVTDEVRGTLAGGDVALMDGPTDSVLAFAEHVRVRANKIAKQSEDAAQAARAVADAALASVAGVRLRADAPTLAVAEEAARETSAKVTRVTLLAGQRKDHEARVAKIRETLGKRPDVDAAVVAEHDAARREREAADALLVAKDAMTTASSNQSMAATIRRQVEDAARKWDEQKKIMDQPVSGPTDEDVAAASEVEAAAKATLEASRIADKEANATANAKLRLAEVTKAKELAAAMRDVAGNVGTRLGEILANHGLPGMSVVGGRLVACVGGKDVLFAERLSVGQRVWFALSIAVKAFPGRVIPLDPAFWASLQPSVQSEVAERAKEQGVFLVTEAPNDDDVISVTR